MPDHGNKINLCLVSEEPEGKEGEWYVLGDLAKVKAKYADFEPRIRKMLGLTDPKDTYVWRFSEIPPLNKGLVTAGEL